MNSLDVDTRVAFRNILLATDFSPCSQVALPHALALARSFQSKLYLAHVLLPEAPREQQRRSAEEQMAGLVNSECFQSIAPEVLLEEGRPWQVLSRIIQQHTIDLLVIGTHGRKGMQKLLLGSVAEEVLLSAPCAVLSVGPQVSGGPRRPAERQEVLYASDFTPHSQFAAPYAIALAQGLRAHLTLLHVGPHPADTFPFERAQIAKTSLARLRALVPPGTEMEGEPEFMVEFGYPAETILSVAADRQADWIVFGVRRGGGFTRAASHLPGGTAYKVTCEARCPLLTVRGPEMPPQAQSAGRSIS